MAAQCWQSTRDEQKKTCLSVVLVSDPTTRAVLESAGHVFLPYMLSVVNGLIELAAAGHLNVMNVERGL